MTNVVDFSSRGDPPLRAQAARLRTERAREQAVAARKEARDLADRGRARRLAARALGLDWSTILGKARRGGPRGPSPFTLPEFPPPARPPGGARMAMDDSTAWAGAEWQRSLFSSVLAEGLAFPGYAFLAEQAQRPEYRRFAEIIATEMTRKWIRLQSVGDEDESEKIKDLTDALDNLRTRDVIRRIIELDEMFGRAHLYVDTGATDDRDELRTSIGSGRDEISRAKIGRGSVRALRAVEPVWCYPTSYDANDPLRADWYEPSAWFVMGKEVHKSRILKFVGREVPDLLKPAYSFGGLSMTQMSKAYVDNWLRTRQSVADLIHAFSVFVLKTNLGSALEDGGDLLFKRVELFNLLRDNRGMMMVSKDDEDLTNVSAPLGGLEGLQAQTQEHMAAVAGIPIVKLLGIQPTGLNASDEGGIRMFYDWILASQQRRIRPHLTTVIDLVQLSIWGEVSDTIVYEFEPLFSLDEKGQADVREVEMRTAVAAIDAGVLAPEEVRKTVASDPDSPYASIDVENVPDLQQEEEQGLDPRAGGGQKGIGRPPKSPENQQGGEEGEDSDEDLSPFERRVRDRGERHARGEGDFYDRSRARPGREMDPRYLEKRIAEREAGPGTDGPFGADAKRRDWSSLASEYASIHAQAAREFAAAFASVGARMWRDDEARSVDRGQILSNMQSLGDSFLDVLEIERPLTRLDSYPGVTARQRVKLDNEIDAITRRYRAQWRGAVRNFRRTIGDEARFEETDHPRDDGGKFTSGGGGGGAKIESEKTGSGRSGPAGTTKERIELRKQIRDEKDEDKKTDLREKLADSYHLAAERAAKAGNRAKFEKFRGRLQKLGAVHGEAEVLHPDVVDEAYVEKVRSIARDVAKKRGFRDLSRIKVSGDHRTMRIGDKEITYAGSYTPRTGEVTVFAKNAPVGFVGNIVAHEVMHDKWQHATKMYGREQSALAKRYNEHPDEMRPDGSLTSEAAREFPVYAAMHEAFASVDPEVFASTDGVTPYSEMWWRAYRAGDASLDQAVNETLAEMSAKKYDTGELPTPYANRLISYRELGGKSVGEKDEKRSHAAWKKLFDTIEKLYEKSA